MENMSIHSDDLYDGADLVDLGAEAETTPFRMVVCMFPEASFRLRSCQYLQCDIGFKRVAGFKEFELGGRDPETRLSEYPFP